MDGKLILEPTVFSKGGLFSAFKRTITGQSLINQQITNKTKENLKLSLSSPLIGSINKIEIQPNQKWKFSPSSFIAGTSNIILSGDINILGNISAAIGGQNIIYVEVSTYDGNPGIVWISAYGALEKHEIQMGKNSEKLLINDGVFLGMLAEDTDKKINYWKNFVHTDSANGILKGLLTKTAFMMSIEDIKRNASDDTKCILYTQSLNIKNLQNYIKLYSSLQSQQNSGLNFSLFNGGSNLYKLQKYQNKLNNI
jgi:hypothetical protein